MQPMTVELNKIYCGDATVVLRGFPDSSVDCVVTSPPYFGLQNYGVDGQIGLEDSPEEYIRRLIGVFMECQRVLKSDGFGLIWVIVIIYNFLTPKIQKTLEAAKCF